MKTIDELGISPTPWYVQEYSYYTNGPAVEGALVFDENGGQRDIFSDDLTSIENARLIAAAPNMYRELYDSWRFCKWLITSGQSWLVERAQKRMKMIEAALAKASGEKVEK